MGSHSVTCHPAEVTFLPLPQPECCHVDDTSPEHTITGLPPRWVDTDVSWLYISINPPHPGSTMVPSRSPPVAWSALDMWKWLPFVYGKWGWDQGIVLLDWLHLSNTVERLCAAAICHQGWWCGMFQNYLAILLSVLPYTTNVNVIAKTLSSNFINRW